MTTALLIGAAVLLLTAFVGGVFVGRKSIATGAPTPASANAAAIPEADKAAADAEAAAQTKAQEVLHASDDDIRARIEQLRARGKAGE
jgi:hypothetical protein